MASATRTSNRMKPSSRRMGHTHAAGQPADADPGSALAVDEDNTATGRAAVRLEANVGDLGTPYFSSRGQNDDVRTQGQLHSRSVGAVGGAVREVDRVFSWPVGGNRVLPGCTQAGNDLRGD